MPPTTRQTLQQRPRSSSTSRQFSTANVTDLPGGPTSGAGDIRPRESGGGIRVTPFPGTQATGPRPGTTATAAQPAQEIIPLPERQPVSAFRPAPTPNVPQAPGFGTTDPRIQALIEQIAQNTQSGATSGQPFQTDRRAEQIINQLRQGGGQPVFEDTTGRQRAIVDRLIAQLESGAFEFDPTRDAETRAFRVLRERERARAQEAAAERLAASPADTGVFDVDTRALREQAGEDIAGFGAARASQRRAEVLRERTGAANTALENLGQIQASDVARFNAASSAAANEQNERVNALQAILRESDSERALSESSRNRTLQGQQDLLRTLLAEQARVQGSRAGAGQQEFENAITAGQFGGGQQQQLIQNQRQAGADEQERAMLLNELRRQARQDAIRERGATIGNELSELDLEDRRRQRRPGGGIRIPRSTSAGTGNVAQFF